MSPKDGVTRFYKALILKNLGETNSALMILQQLLKSANDPQDISRIDAEIEVLQRPFENPLSRVR